MTESIQVMFPLATGGGGGGGGPTGNEVMGPDSVSNGHLAVFDGTTGKLLKDGGPIPSFPSKASSISNEDEGYTTGAQVFGYSEAKSNKVTSLSAQSTDAQYPSAKCVYDAIGDIETLLASI